MRRQGQESAWWACAGHGPFQLEVCKHVAPPEAGDKQTPRHRQGSREEEGRAGTCPEAGVHPPSCNVTRTKDWLVRFENMEIFMNIR